MPLQLLLMYIFVGVFAIVVLILALPTLISRDINKKNEKKIRELEDLLKRKNQLA